MLMISSRPRYVAGSHGSPSWWSLVCPSYASIDYRLYRDYTLSRLYMLTLITPAVTLNFSDPRDRSRCPVIDPGWWSSPRVRSRRNRIDDDHRWSCASRTSGKSARPIFFIRFTGTGNDSRVFFRYAELTGTLTRRQFHYKYHFNLRYTTFTWLAN